MKEYRRKSVRLRLIVCAGLTLGVAAATGCSGGGTPVPDVGVETSGVTEDAGTTAPMPLTPPAAESRDASPPKSSASDASDTSVASEAGDAQTPLADSGACGAGCRLVFVTKATFTGDLQGNAGADAKCKAAAAASTHAPISSRSTRFIAWISTGAAGSPGPGTRLGNAEYRRMDGTLVAASLAGLLSGSLLAPINVTERGDSLGTGAAAWTGTAANGTASNFTCNGWSTNLLTVAGDVGTPPDTGTAWSISNTMSCSASQRIYCIEGGP